MPVFSFSLSKNPKPSKHDTTPASNQHPPSKRLSKPRPSKHASPAREQPSSLTALPQPSQNQYHSYYTHPQPPPPPLPELSPLRAHTDILAKTRSYLSSNDFSSPPSTEAPVYEIRSLAFGKPANSGFATPPLYADSGYESGQSRAPSDMTYPEYNKPIPRESSSFLPKLRFNDDHLGQAVLRAGQTSTTHETRDVTLESEGDVSPIDPEAETLFMKSPKSTSKRARFEDLPPEPLPDLGALQHFLDVSAKDTHSTPATQQADEPPTIRQHTISSIPERRPIFPPLSILEGLKINKKGKILDEEGDPIGELVEGDLLDCVREKANANGEVVDECGRVVGIVRVIAAPHHSMNMPTGTVVTEQASPGTQLRRESRQLRRQSDTSSSKRHVSNDLTPHPVQPQPEQPTKQRFLPAHETTPPRQQETSIPSYSTDISRTAVTEQLDQQYQISCHDHAEDIVQDQPRRQPRSASERALSDLSKPFVRPIMNVVPENNIADSDVLPETSELYAYRGEIPPSDRPQREARSRSPHVAINPKAALALGQSNSAMIGPGVPGSSRMGARRFSSQSAVNHPNYPAKNHSFSSLNAPMISSPLNSHDSSPRRGDLPRTSFGSQSRNASYSAMSTASKPRTYFSHAGRITIDPNAPPKPAKAPSIAASEATAPGQPTDKRKRRFSFHRGRQ